MMNEEKRILTVNDLVTMKKALDVALERMGYHQITNVKDEREALAALKQWQFDLVITDCDMSEFRGLELLKALREHPTRRHIPYLMFSTAQNKDKALNLIAQGADELLIKPFTYAAFKNKVNELLSLRQSPERLVGHLAPVPETMVEEKSGPGDKSRILVVDDMEMNIELVTSFLNKRHTAISATNGERAIAIAESDTPPDLILLDIVMPGMDGLEVCRQLKANLMTQSIPVIFLTGMDETRDIVRGLALGAVDYVTKPVNLKILNARVDTHLQLKQSRDKLQREVDLQTSNARLRDDVERITRHDLKNPVGSIINIASVLASDETCSESIREGLEYIEEAAYEMLEMINRSLDLYKMETGSYQLSPGPVDLHVLLEKVQRDTDAVARPKGITVTLALAPGEATISGEELLCYSLFGNLLRNAIEASPTKGKVLIESLPAASHVIRISNAGAIPEEIRAHFFDKYVTSGKSSGTGLGTYSAKLLTEIQGGNIGFTTSEETGTTIAVTLDPYSRND